MSWDNAYSIGHDKVDKEHKRLFEIASEIYQCNNNKEEVMSIVKELIKYTKFHFKNEENYMKSIGYAGLEEHSNIHNQIVQNLNVLVKKFPTMQVGEIVKSLTDFIYSGILQHILLVDKKVHHTMKSRLELKHHFQWKNDYKINHEIIDKEHEELFKIALKALNYHDKDIKKHIKKTISELYEYMKKHFENEEDYMLEIGYPELGQHIDQHMKIIEEMNNFIKSIPTLKLIDFERKLIEYIDIWLINHILYEDRKILMSL